NAVQAAIETGYTHIDTAAIYGNEKGVGEGIRRSGTKREDLFLVSKVWNDRQAHDDTLAAFQESLDRLGTDYLDLYLVHWPKPLSGECWSALEKLHRDGKARAIGVCNFTPGQMDELLKTAEIVPMVNQVELHPQFPQHELQAYCREKGMLVESWGPLMQGKIFGIPLVEDMAARHGCTVAQLAVAWQFQQDNICLVKSVSPQRIRENFQVPDITFDSADLELLAGLEGDRVGADPENFDF
ncbi:MAG: aldo/keto reductase, partial [Desulfobacterales bacterium]|nr:aldo/keto reductase [Desulfobacterales bacterium]